jgi:NAD(P)-dependent dehydrogenase (short-subunit alcohol dehydrogenase family)
VALCGRREQEGLANAAKLDSSGDTAIFIRCDVASYGSQRTLFKEVWEKWQRLDVVVANAGVVDRDSKYNLKVNLVEGLKDNIPEEPDMTCTDVNLKGPIFSIHLATHYMPLNPGGKGGKVIVTSSVLGIYANPTFPEYCAAKAGINQYVKAVAPILLRNHDITINCVMPGPIETGVMPDFVNAFPPEYMTLKSDLMRCFKSYLEDTARKTGTTMEVGSPTLIERGYPSHATGPSQECWATPYEPWFAALHGEMSGLPNARPGPPTFSLVVRQAL